GDPARGRPAAEADARRLRARPPLGRRRHPRRGGRRQARRHPAAGPPRPVGRPAGPALHPQPGGAHRPAPGGGRRPARPPGHEGVVVKDPTAPYAAGRRGAGWVKVKPRRTADLVVLAVEWGSGRREGWLSNIHLGARDPQTGELVMVGKTFKGMTDAILTWQ